MYYSAIGLIAIGVLIIVNQDILRNHKESYVRPVWKVYRRFLIAVLAYYITDVLWGILDSNKLSKLLFIDTTVYFVAMSIGILLWAVFAVEYLEEKNKVGRFLTFTGRVIAGMITLLVIINIFTPVLFSVDDDCTYHALPVRYAVLTCQIVMFLLISVFAITSMFRLEKDSARKSRFRILASFGIIMAVLLFIQLFFPLLPVYSIGYMLGTCMLHTFVANDEKEEYKRGLKEKEKITEFNDTITSLLDNMPGMTFTKDAKTGEYIACNQAFARFAHKDNPSEVIGRIDDELFDAETAKRFVEDDRIAVSLSTPYIFFDEIQDEKGESRQLQTTKTKYIDISGRLCVLGIRQDVTDIARIQHENAMTKEAYEKAVSTSMMYNNIAKTLARDYIDIYYINKDSEEFVQYRKVAGEGALTEVRRGWHFFSDCKNELAETVYDEDRASFLEAMNRKTLMKALKSKDTFAMTYRQMREGVPFYVNMKISLMDEEHYIIMGIMDIDSEMRETIAKNEALANALNSVEQANKAKTDFLSGMSHEIRTPINTIVGLKTLALKNKDINDETRDYLNKIGDSANNLLSIVDDILDMSRIEAGRVSLNKEEFSFSSMMEQINSIVKPKCEEKGLSFENTVLNQVGDYYYGDDKKLKDVLFNILSNAVKFTEAPGSVKVTVEKLSEEKNSDKLRFCIKDTGIGMDEKQIARLFDDYSEENIKNRAKFGSSGLGMAITKKAVEMMGGAVSVKSEKGVGTEFTVVVVLDKCDINENASERMLDLNSLYVLVVDDDLIEVEHVKTVLDEVGVRADTCTSGQEALNKMALQSSKQDPYNLILMDWNMPEMNGMTTSAEIRKLYGESCTVVAMTAYSREDIQDEANSVGVHNFITKPVFESSIISSFEQIARRSKVPLFKAKKQAKLSGRRILLAEDVDINAEIIMDTLELENIKVDHATTGKVAVDMFEKSTAGIYAAILMDVRMPEMDGLEASRIIRAMDREDAKRIPIIALTANTFDEDVQLSIQAGMNAHLTKPVESNALLRTLGELVYEAEQG